MESRFDRVRKAWNVFKGRDSPMNETTYVYYGSANPSRSQLTPTHGRTIMSSIINRMAVDAAGVSIKHVEMDEQNRYKLDIDSSLNECLNISANDDESGHAFRMNLFQSLLDEGCVAVVPEQWDVLPNENVEDCRCRADRILSIRCGKVVEWVKDKVTVELYNYQIGDRYRVTVPKKYVAIIYNPFWDVMNAPNSTMTRLNRKLAALDKVDEEVTSDKLNILIQVPYAIKSQGAKERAEERRKGLEGQLVNNKLGVGYIDSTEKIITLSKPLENTFNEQIEQLTNTLYAQLGITEEILNGSANEQTMINYYNRTIDPIVTAVIEELRRKFIPIEEIRLGQNFMYFRSPFKFTTVESLANAADKLVRNAIVSPNEFRMSMGLKPDDSGSSDELANRNMPVEDQIGYGNQSTNTETEQENYEE